MENLKRSYFRILVSLIFAGFTIAIGRASSTFVYAVDRDGFALRMAGREDFSLVRSPGSVELRGSELACMDAGLRRSIAFCR